MAANSRRSRHQISDSALEALAQLGDDPSRAVELSDDKSEYPDGVDAEHPLRCLHVA